MSLNDYKTIIFDCDGVVLNSNKVKTEAFYNTALQFGTAAAKRLVKYHVERGGISRYEKFQWFIDSLTEEDLAQSESEPNLDSLLVTYASEVHKGLRSCEVAEGLAELREKTKGSTWLIVSGGDQAELRELFTERNIAQYFDGGIFGSPDTKDEILSREIKNGNITLPALFLGDSKYDYEAANKANLDFIFLSGWSEVTDWNQWVCAKDISVLDTVSDLINNNL